MNRVFEHEVDEVGVRLHELIKLLQVSQLTALFLVEDVEVIFTGVKLHIFDLRR